MALDGSGRRIKLNRVKGSWTTPDNWTLTYDIKSEPNSVTITNAQGAITQTTQGPLSPAILKRMINRFFDQHLNMH